MRLIFAGTPEFAARALAALHLAGHDIALVLTQPDRPAGRGLKLQPSAVKTWALEHGLEVYQPTTLRADHKTRAEEGQAAQARLRAVGAAVMVVAAYGLILPQAVLDIPSHGCINIHASLLPRWRGAAPIQRAIEAGDVQSGITLMQMDAGLDTGDMLLASACPIDPAQTAGELHDVLADLGARMIVEALGQLDALVRRPQPEGGVTYAHKIDKAESQLDPALSASVLVRRIHAFNPFPGAQLLLEIPGGQPMPVKCWRAMQYEASTDALPGTVLGAGADGVDVACGEGTILRLTELQKPGGKRLPAREFLAGFALRPGQRFVGGAT